MSLDVCDAPSDVEQDVDVVVDGEQAREGAADKNVHGQAQVPHIVGAPVPSADSAPRHSGSARVMAHSEQTASGNDDHVRRRLRQPTTRQV